MVTQVDTNYNLESLYKRVSPALKTKCNDFKRIGKYYVSEADIWNYLKNNVWCKASNLSLSDVVNDIMTVDYDKIDAYLKNNL